MARILVAPTAREDLERLIRTHSLPSDTRQRVRRSVEPLGRFPRLGAELGGRWEGFRFVLGPWRWMIVVYAFDASTDEVVVVTIQDGRTASVSTASR